ncbi:MAG TPA: hypothetical protein VFV58_33795 [Blastocatellia bacterium]|jgi:hypothetical protein|nr:hypothetical protein [Blastocatellia bacterium]
MRRLFVFILLFTSLAIANRNPCKAAANDADNNGYKVESIAELKEATVAEAVRGALEPKGVRVINDSGKAICEVWFNKEIPTAKNEIPGASFGQIPEGAFIGVINFPSNISDFRGQGIKAGFYTLRFALILQDGNHLGVSPARDFFLLCPAGEDKDPTAQLKMEDLLKMSRSASGTGHPTVWFVGQATSDKDLPKIVKNEHEHVILETKISTKSGPLAIGMVVIGQTEG